MTAVGDSNPVLDCQHAESSPSGAPFCATAVQADNTTDAVLDPTAAPADKQAGPSDCDNTAPHAHPVGIEHSAPAHNNSPSDPQLL